MLRRAMKEKESRVHITQRPAEGDDDDILKLVRILDIGSSLSPTDSTFNPHKLLKLISSQRRNVQSYLSDTSSSQTIYNSLHHDSFLPDNECGGTRNGRRFVHLLRSQITHTTSNRLASAESTLTQVAWHTRTRFGYDVAFCVCCTWKQEEEEEEIGETPTPSGAADKIVGGAHVCTQKRTSPPFFFFRPRFFFAVGHFGTRSLSMTSSSSFSSVPFFYCLRICTGPPPLYKLYDAPKKRGFSFSYLRNSRTPLTFDAPGRALFSHIFL